MTRLATFISILTAPAVALAHDGHGHVHTHGGSAVVVVAFALAIVGSIFSSRKAGSKAVR